MSTAQALRNLEHEIGEEVDRDLSKVVALKKQPVSRYVAPDPENEQDRIAAAHRHSITKRKQRIADTKKGLKATLASIAAARKEEKARHEAALAEFVEREAEAKAQAARDIDADQRIVSSCEAALEVLTAD
jgi:hypothetical protein